MIFLNLRMDRSDRVYGEYFTNAFIIYCWSFQILFS